MMSTNKSRPEYVRLAPDLHGTRHWFITNGASAEDCVRASLALAGLAPMEVWEVQDPKRHGAGVTFHEARERTFADDTPDIARANPVDSLDWPDYLSDLAARSAPAGDDVLDG